MTKLKSFLERRNATLNKQKQNNLSKQPNDSNIIDSKFTDDDFWKVMNTLKQQRKTSSESEIKILENILEDYNDEQLIKFEKIYKRLNG